MHQTQTRAEQLSEVVVSVLQSRRFTTLQHGRTVVVSLSADLPEADFEDTVSDLRRLALPWPIEVHTIEALSAWQIGISVKEPAPHGQ